MNVKQLIRFGDAYFLKYCDFCATFKKQNEADN